MAAVEITRRDLSVSELRSAAARTASAKQARCILAIAMVLDGHDRTLAAPAGGMDRQTLRDWAHRYNADGVDEAIVDACCNVWKGLIAKPEVITSIGTRKWAQVSI